MCLFLNLVWTKKKRKIKLDQQLQHNGYSDTQYLVMLAATRGLYSDVGFVVIKVASGVILCFQCFQCFSVSTLVHFLPGYVTMVTYSACVTCSRAGCVQDNKRSNVGNLFQSVTNPTQVVSRIFQNQFYRFCLSIY